MRINKPSPGAALRHFWQDKLDQIVMRVINKQQRRIRALPFNASFLRPPIEQHTEASRGWIVPIRRCHLPAARSEPAYVLHV